ncbi:hypothetical protein [Pseudooceanicola algae]|uniref:Uncharacterized protein n=1 Tax=Pseudooceanicola algae TaxID=1537215 RepID=A0A418SKI4_9RHOB|nr:hypothetical protein [Pseudooceanicola algae]QPM90722.1 hypothetical protein PSAL_019610 [Pseudooceanicola algae]
MATRDPNIEKLGLQPADRDAVFVLAADPEAPAMAALLAPERLEGGTGPTLARLLGLPETEAGAVDLINPSDLEGVGLATYLIDGMGLEAKSVNADRATLEALQGPVVLLRPRFLEGEPRILQMSRGLSLVGRYDAPRQPIGLTPLRAVAASGIGGPTSVPPAGPTPRSMAWLAMLVLGIGMVLALLALGLWLL